MTLRKTFAAGLTPIVLGNHRANLPGPSDRSPPATFESTKASRGDVLEGAGNCPIPTFVLFDPVKPGLFPIVLYDRLQSAVGALLTASDRCMTISMLS